MRKIITVVSMLACATPAHADELDDAQRMESEMNAWDTFVNTNAILSRSRQMQQDMRALLEEQRRTRILEERSRRWEQEPVAPSMRQHGRAYDPDHDCAKCAPRLDGFTTDTGEIWGFKPHTKE